WLASPRLLLGYGTDAALQPFGSRGEGYPQPLRPIAIDATNQDGSQRNPPRDRRGTRQGTHDQRPGGRGRAANNCRSYSRSERQDGGGDEHLGTGIARSSEIAGQHAAS